MFWLWLGLGVCLVLVVFWWIGRSVGTPEQARRLLAEQRPRLQDEFFQAAAGSGKPRGLRWLHCDWDAGYVLARERRTGRLAALVGVTIQFEAIPGSDMEGLPAVANLRNASAVFFFHQGRWHTTGQTLFNLNPDEVLTRFQQLYAQVSPAGRMML